MVKKFENLVLKENTTFDESIEVEGNITCENQRWNLKVAGNIDARNINAWNIDAENIDAWNINARNIDAWNINAKDINAWNIDAWNIDAEDIDARNIDAWNIDARNINAKNIVFCDKIKRTKKTKIRTKALIENRSKLEQKEWK